MKYNKADEGIRERLLVAGLKELEDHGFNDFSLRRVAANCDVSCAAPYKHFKNKEELIMALMNYIRTRWFMLRDHILAMYCDKPTKKQLVEICVAYASFLLATPSYITIMTERNDQNEFVSELRGRMSSPVMDLIYDVVGQTQMSDRLKFKVLYTIRAYIYGTVCLIRNDEVEDPDAAMALFREVLERILDDAVETAEKESKKDSEG